MDVTERNKIVVKLMGKEYGSVAIKHNKYTDNENDDLIKLSTEFMNGEMIDWILQYFDIHSIKRSNHRIQDVEFLLTVRGFNRKL
ncbi:hypothetical protein KAT92_06435 [Candidatus Babeliales bacterium]|nr:hypothetical protein [Candidatus Babeliales bacterium]